MTSLCLWLYSTHSLCFVHVEHTSDCISFSNCKKELSSASFFCMLVWKLKWCHTVPYDWTKHAFYILTVYYFHVYVLVSAVESSISNWIQAILFESDRNTQAFSKSDRGPSREQLLSQCGAGIMTYHVWATFSFTQCIFLDIGLK